MLLKKGASKKVFDQNVSELIRSGRETDQALAIAFRQQREAKQKNARKKK